MAGKITAASRIALHRHRDERKGPYALQFPSAVHGRPQPVENGKGCLASERIRLQVVAWDGPCPQHRVHCIRRQAPIKIGVVDI
eukprot:857802-Pleurochrysis_carterae.AAC.1